MLITVIVILIFFALSFFFSGIETGLVSLDRYKLEQESKSDERKKSILSFIKQSDKIFGTILIGNNISNVIIASLSTVLFSELNLFNNNEGTLIIAFLVLIFGELIPKTIFRDYSEKLVYLFFPLFQLVYFLLKPLVFIVSLFNDFLKKRFNITEYDSFHFFTKDDVAFILSETMEDSNIEHPQKEMLEDALEFNQLKAKNIMIPRLDVVAIPDTLCIDEIIELAKKEGYTRYPVYHETLDEITGVLIIYDIISKMNNKELKAKDIQREVFFAPEMMDADNLLKEMQTKKKSMAVIVDSYGGTSGILTIEDIIEEIVGDIEDEYDEEEKDIEIINNHTLLVKAVVDIDRLIDDFDLDIPKGDYETLAGFIISKLEKIPTAGQVLNEAQFKLEVVQVSNRKIEKVKITKTTGESNYLKMKKS